LQWLSKQETAVVTGSTSGIGLGIAHALALDGANIVLNGLGTEKDNGEGPIAEVKKHGTRRGGSMPPTCCATIRSPR